MPDASVAKLLMEQGQAFQAMAAASDSGDHTTFSASSSLPAFSRRDGYEPTILVNGLKSGGAVTPAVSGTDDLVDTAALVCNLNGVADTSVTADTDISCTRPATAVSKVISITVDNSGAIAAVAGTDGSTTAFSETRGANGGPPLIPTDSIEIAQVRMTSDTSAPIAASEIFQVVGTHKEMVNYPLYTIDYANGDVVFNSALPLIHTGPVPKAVYASYYVPTLVELQDAYDFVPPENSHSSSSTQVYNSTKAATSSSLNQGSFSQLLQNGHDDPVITYKDDFLWFKFFQNRNNTPYHLVQAKLGIARTFPAGDNIAASCTLSAETIGTDYSS